MKEFVPLYLVKRISVPKEMSNEEIHKNIVRVAEVIAIKKN